MRQELLEAMGILVMGLGWLMVLADVWTMSTGQFPVTFASMLGEATFRLGLGHVGFAFWPIPAVVGSAFFLAQLPEKYRETHYVSGGKRLNREGMIHEESSRMLRGRADGDCF